MANDWRIEEADGVLTFTLTRDRRLNAVTGEMAAAMRAAARDVEERDDLQVLVYAAEGRYFTAGMDLGAVAENPSGATFRRTVRRLHDAFDELEAMEKPVILAAQGGCLGFGLEMAASCDFRLASEDASFGLPEIANLGLLPGSGGISRLTRIIGPHWTKWIVMAGKRVSADEALRMGLVHAVYPAADFAARVHEFAVSVARMPLEAVGLAKLAIDHAATGDRVATRDFDRVAQTYLMTTAGHRAKLEALAQRAREKQPG